MMNRLTIFVCCMLLGLTSIAQQGGVKLNLPQDPNLSDEAKRRFALSVDDMSLNRYRQAANSLHWLMKNVPKLYDGLYVNAYKAYEELAEKESDASKKKVYLDSMFVSYKLKEEHFELSDLEINNLAYRYYKYHKDDEETYDEALKVFEQVYQKPSEVINNNLGAYMDIARKSYAKKQNLTEDQVLDIYSKINEVIDQKIAAGESESKFANYRDVLNKMLTSVINVDCGFIEQKLYPSLKANPSNINLAKKIFQLSLEAECSDQEFFLYAVEIVHKGEPTAGLAAVLGRRFMADKKYNEAEKYFKESISLETDPEKKAEVQLSLAKVYYYTNNKTESRDQALKAAQLSKNVAPEAYSLIGNLYMNSFDTCKQGKSHVTDRAVFFAAHDMFTKAGDVDGQNRAKAQFPTKSQVFELNLEEGASIQVGCWINTTSTIKTRPSD